MRRIAIIGVVLMLSVGLVAFSKIETMPAQRPQNSRVGDNGPMPASLNKGQVKKTNPEIEALIAAASKGDTAAVRSLRAKGLDVNLRNNFGDTALSRAATNGHLETVGALLELGADANAAEGIALRSAAIA